MVGLFADMVVIRGDLAGRPSFVELVRRMHATVTEAVEHQDVPFRRLVEELDPGNGPHDLPFFDIVINYTGDRQRIPARWGDLAVEVVDLDEGTSTYALTNATLPYALELATRGPEGAALADPAVKARYADLGLDIATKEQQTPEGLAAFNKAEIDKWWPIIKAAGIKAE